MHGHPNVKLPICICTDWSCFLQSIIVFVSLKTGTLNYIILAYRVWYGHLNPQVAMVPYVSRCWHLNAT